MVEAHHTASTTKMGDNSEVQDLLETMLEGIQLAGNRDDEPYRMLLVA